MNELRILFKNGEEVTYEDVTTAAKRREIVASVRSNAELGEIDRWFRLAQDGSVLEEGE